VSTLIARKKADGTEAFSCQISTMRNGAIVHRESRTFSNRAMAKAWGERRERDLAKPGGLEAAKIGKETLADAIDKYVATSRKEIGRTKAQVLESIKGMDIADKRCSGRVASQMLADAQAGRTVADPFAGLAGSLSPYQGLPAPPSSRIGATILSGPIFSSTRCADLALVQSTIGDYHSWPGD
jgi:hypothetical protein